MESIHVLVTSRCKGEAVQNLESFQRAYDECIELRQQSKEVWLGRALLALQGMDRWEIAAFTDESFAGGLVLAHDPWDVCRAVHERVRSVRSTRIPPTRHQSPHDARSDPNRTLKRVFNTGVHAPRRSVALRDPLQEHPMKSPKIDTSGTEAAQKAVAEAQAAANNLSSNFKADLQNQNLTSVVAGGSADTAGAEASTTRKRRTQGGLSSSLGIS